MQVKETAKAVLKSAVGPIAAFYLVAAIAKMFPPAAPDAVAAKLPTFGKAGDA